MESRRLTYSFRLPEGQLEEFVLEYDTTSLELLHRETENLPDWTGLNFHKCPHCTLDASDTPRCPLTVSIVAVVTRSEQVEWLSQNNQSYEIYKLNRKEIVTVKGFTGRQDKTDG